MLLALAACAPERVIESWRVLNDVAAGPGQSALKEGTAEPSRTAVAYEIEGRAYTGDLYRPRDDTQALLVLVPGAAPEGKDDPRLVAFAKTLARARFTVLVPEIANLRALRVRPSDVRHIADAVQRAAAMRAGDEIQPIGIIAISYAAGPALLAAIEPDVRGDVGFLMAIGGYYDIEAVVTFFTTGGYRLEPEAPWRFATPNAFGKWLFVRANAERMSTPRDRVLLTALAERKLRDPHMDVADLVAELGPEGRAVQALLANEDPAAVPGLIGGLPEAIRTDLQALDVKRGDLSRLAARLILIHGRDDAIIPYSESLALAAALPKEQVTTVVVGNLAHVELGPGGWLDGLRLWYAVYCLLAERDRR